MTFAGFPSAGEQGKNKSDFAIVGVPSDLGVTYIGGQRLAPHFIREAGHWQAGELADPQTGSDFYETQVYDWGDCEIVTGDAAATARDVETTVKGIMARTDRLIVLGGDDSVNYPVLRGLTGHLGRKINLIHLDAHHDTYPRAEHKRRDHGTWVTDVCVDDCVNRLYQLGMRAYGNPESVSKHTTVAHKFYIDEIMENLNRVLVEVVNSLSRCKPKFPTYLAVDIDVVDPAYAPGTAIPEPGGLTSFQIRKLVKAFAPLCVGMSITEVLPAKDPTGITSLLANRLVLDYMQHAMSA